MKIIYFNDVAPTCYTARSVVGEFIWIKEQYINSYRDTEFSESTRFEEKQLGT